MFLLGDEVECQVEGEDDVGDVNGMEPDGDVDVGKEKDVGDANVGMEGDVEDDGGEDIGEHDGVEPSVEGIGDVVAKE